MDLKLLAKQITKAVKESSKHNEIIKGREGYPIAWHFMMEDDVVGFVLLDDGNISGLEPSVAICLVAESADDYDREDLLNMLGANFALTDAAIAILPSPVEISDMVIIIFNKRPLEVFRASDFANVVSHLVKQREIVFSLEYEDEEEDEEDDEEDEDEEDEDEEDEDVFSVIESLFMDEDEEADKDLPKQGGGRKRKKQP